MGLLGRHPDLRSKELRTLDKSFEHYLDMEDNNPEATTPAFQDSLAPSAYGI
jgi:phage head maturation protease